MESKFFSSDWPGPFPRRVAMAGGPGPGPGKRGRGRRRHLEQFERFAAMRHMHGEPPFGDPLFGPPFGRRRSRGRKRRGDVRTALLLLLHEEPRNGYQLMQVIEERSDGSWRPSPGSVYPVLSQLEDEGLVRATERDGTKLFELTDAGREFAANAETGTPPWETSEHEGPPFKELRHLIPEIARASAHVIQSGNEAQVAQAIETLKQTRRSLYRILAEDEVPGEHDAEDEDV